MRSGIASMSILLVAGFPALSAQKPTPPLLALYLPVLDLDGTHNYRKAL